MRSNNFIYMPVLFSFICAFILMLIPVGHKLIWLRPDLVTLLVIYWVTSLPNHIGIFFAFTIGLLFDLLTGTLLGTMALTLGVVAFLTMNLRLRFRLYRFWQKFIVVMLLVACSQLIRLWIQMLIGHPPATFMYWICSLTSAMMWPLLYIILRSYQRTLKLA